MVRTFTGVRGWMCRSVLLCADLGTQSCEEEHVVKKKKMQIDSNQTKATVTTLRSNPSAEVFTRASSLSHKTRAERCGMCGMGELFVKPGLHILLHFPSCFCSPST
jgi:hypothetical protein